MPKYIPCSLVAEPCRSVHMTAAASIRLEECKHGSVCPRCKRDGQHVDIFVLFSLLVKCTCSKGYWMLTHLPSPELRGWVFFVTLSLKEGERRMNCALPLPPLALYVSKVKIYMHMGRNVCRSRSYQWGGWEGAICSPALQVLLFPRDCCSEILLISCPKKISCLAVSNQYCERFGSYCLWLLSLQLLGCKLWLIWGNPKSPCFLLWRIFLHSDLGQYLLL